MNLKSIFCLQIIFLILITTSCCDKTTTGCKDPLATNYDRNADESCDGCCTYPPKQGGVLFWSEDPNAIPTCGTFTILINNKTTIITGYYNNPGPVNCVNVFGGYVLLDVGTYQYIITRSSGCPGGNGTITVNEGCNLVKID